MDDDTRKWMDQGAEKQRATEQKIGAALLMDNEISRANGAPQYRFLSLIGFSPNDEETLHVARMMGVQSSSGIDLRALYSRGLRWMAFKEHKAVWGQKVGRNSLCPCGSRKKSKRCCWDIYAEMESLGYA